MKFEDLPNTEQKLEQWKHDHEAGDGAALLHAVALCLNLGIAAPSWVVTAFNAAWYVRYEGAEARTLGEAFKVHRPEGWTKKRKSKDVLIFVAWQEVLELRAQPGAVLGQPLFADVAERLNKKYPGVYFNSTDVQTAYYAVSALSKKR